MKFKFRFVIFLLNLFFFSCSAFAIEEMGVENPKLKKIPKAILSVLPKYDRDYPHCKYLGNKIFSKDEKAFWFVVNQCGGSGGRPLYLVEISETKPRVLIDSFGASHKLIIYDTYHNGMPDMAILDGGSTWGYGVSIYHFDGDTYQHVTNSYMTGINTTMWDDRHLPKELLEVAVTDPTWKCEHGNGELNHFYTQISFDGIYIFSSQCLNSDKLRFWLVSPNPKPHIILRGETDFDQIRIGPFKRHGLSNICFMPYSNDGKDFIGYRKSNECFRFNGKTYIRY